MNKDSNSSVRNSTHSSGFDSRSIAAWLFGLVVIWTGLERSVEAVAFKPNAFFFGLVCGLMAIAAAFLFRWKLQWPAYIVSVITFVFVCGFYTYCFVIQPDKDATMRVARVILASIAFISFVGLAPSQKQ